MTLFHEPLPFIVFITAYCSTWIFITSDHSELVHILALWLGFILAILAVIVWIGFNVLLEFQYISVLWENLLYYNSSLTMAFDGYSLVFFMLTIIIMPVIILTSWDYTFGSIKEYIGLLVLTELLLILVFTVLDLFYFYIFFESVLIPMIISIFRWTYQARGSKAAYLLFFYTVFGSLFMLYAVLTLYSKLGSTHLFVLMHQGCPEVDQTLVWFCLFIGFAVKMPVFGLHIWLPEAHVEAPTSVSMLLASLLLKLGGYGFLHFSLPFFYKEKSLYILCAFLLGILGVIFGSGAALHQFDLKRIIAYSSVAHMNLALLGLFSLNYLGISGSVILMVAHGLVSAALFFLIGVLYDRFFTRVIYYFAGLARAMPLFSVFFLFFTLANMGFPGTFNFLGELYILLGLKLVNELALLGGVFGTLLSATYSIWLYNKICFGQLRLETYDSIQNNQTEMPWPSYTWYIDLNAREFSILAILTFFTLFLGLNSDLVLNVIDKPTAYIINKLLEHS